MITVLTIVMMFACMAVLREGAPTEPCLRRIGRLLGVTPALTTGGNRMSMVWRHIAVATLVISLCTADRAHANGTNPTVVGGQASFSTQGSLLNITNSPGTIINWQGFSIGAGETTRFIQQNAASSVLNRVLGSDPSVILGTLTSNGRVFLINPSGVLFGQGARIDVGGLVASTLDLSNQDFQAGRLNFTANPLAGRVENRGSITTTSGGSVYLVGTNVTNSGIINSPGGDVILAAGQTVKILDTGTPGVRVELTANDNLAVNLGEILAQSGQVGIYGAALRNSGIITADQAVRDRSGRIILRAKQDVVLESGSRLSASGEQAGNITVQSETGTTLVSGSVEAKGTGEAAGKGGTIQLLGTRVGLTSASVDASGTTGGGTVLVGGDYQGKNPSVQNASATYVSPDSSIAANAVTSGNGGTAIVWADDSTRFQGSINARGGAQSGNGGFVEVSGKHYLDFSGTVDTRAPMGQAGTLLLDPDEIHIINAAGGATLAMTCLGGGDCTTPTGSGPYTDFAPSATLGILPDHTINQQLALGNVTVQTSAGGVLISNVNGTVTFGPTTGATDMDGGNAASNTNTLTINSASNISWDTPWSYRNTGQVTLLANTGSIEGTGTLTLTGASPLLMQAATGIGSAVTPMSISGNGGNVTLTAGASAVLGNITAGAGTISATSSGSGDITISGALTNTNSGTSAVILNSTSGTGNVRISGGSISTPGRATIFTNSIAGSSGVEALVGSSSGNFRYNGVTTGLGTGTYAVYTEQPTLTISANSPAAITYGDATPALTNAVSGLQNGDSAAQALGTTTSVAVSGPTSNSGNYTAGAHTLTPSAASQLGYALSYANGTLAVNQRALAGSIAAGSSVYGAALVPGAASFSNVVSGDVVTPAAVTVTPDVVSSSGHLTAGSHTGIESVSSTLSGADAANYTFAGAVGNYTVSQLALAGSIAAGGSVYGAALVPGAASFSNVVSGDAVTPAAVVVTPDVVSSSGHLTAGSHTGIESVSSTLSGADAANYTFAGAVGNYTVSQLALDVSAFGVNKTYDGLTTATASLADNRVAGDLFVTAYGTASYLDKNVGNGKTVNVGGITLTGTDAGNYTVNATATATANITPLAITGSISANNKVYDGTAAATIATRTLSGAVAGDTVSYNGGTALFSDKNVAGGKTVTGSGLILSGADAGNYTVNATATTTANITPLAITGSITANSKVYDGTAAATIATRTLSGAVAGDAVSYNGGTALFSDKNVAGGKTVTGSGLILSGADAGNYTVNATATTTANITPAPLEIIANNTTKTYGGTVSFTGTEFSSSGLKNGETIGNVSLSSPGATPTAGVAGGPYDITASAAAGGTFNAGNYSISYDEGTLGVIPAPLGIAANSATRLYGDANPAFSAIYTGFQNGETPAVLTGALTLATPAVPASNVGSYAVIPSGQSSSNYTVAYVDGRLSVTPAPLGIAANSTTKTYGSMVNFTGTEFSSSGLKNGETIGSVSLSSPGAAPTASVAGGPYDITASAAAGGTFSAGNYSISYADGSLGVIPAPLGIAANSATRLYGDANPAFSATYTGFQNGETPAVLTGALTLATPAVPASNVGSYAVIPSGQSSSNYTVAYVNGRLSVTPAPLGIAANSTTKTYGSSVNFTGAEFSSSGLKNGETIGSVSLSSPGAAPTAGVAGGPYDITAGNASGGTFSAGNYSISYTDGTLGVIPAPLGIAADSATRLYGDANPAFSATYTGFQNGETAATLSGTLAFATPAVAASNVGNYAVIPSGQSSSNYTVAYVNGRLSVTPAPLGIAANSATKTYGSTVSFTGTEFSSSGLKNGETVGSVSLSSPGAAPTAGVAGGPYDITAGNASGGTFSAGNYSISYADGTLGVIPAPLGIVANSTSKTYGDTLIFTGTEFSSSGLKNGETVGSVDLASLGAAADAGVAGGPYDITARNAAGGSFNPVNYAISYVDGALGVNPAGLLGIAANSDVKTYNGLAYSGGNGVTYTGFLAGDTPASLNGTLLYSGSSQGAVNVGSYTIIPSGQSSPNYTIAYVNGRLSVIPAPLGIAANSATRLYGDANPAFSATYTGFQNGESPAVLTGALTLATPATAASNVGSYAVIPSGQSSSNYTVAYVNGKLSVTPAPLGIAANSTTKTYGSTVSFTGTEFSSSGLKNGETIGSVSLSSPGAAPTAGVAGGPYDITAGNASGGTFSAGNYSISYADGTLGVIPAPLGIAANSATRLYGDTNPAFSATYTGFQNGETPAVLTGALTLATPAVPASNVGNYAVIPSGQSSSNYTVAYVNGRLNVTPAPLGIAANSATKTYGSTVSFTGAEFSSSGLKNGETIGSVRLSSPGSAPTAGVAGGPYDITASNASGGTFSAGNYSISYADGTMGVIPAPLGIAANSATRLYGDANPVFSATYTGFQNGETAATLSGTLAFATPAVPASNVGSYAVIPSGQSSANYTVAYVDGRLSVTPAPLGIAANSATKTYGSTVSFTGTEFSSSGLKNGETIGSVSLSSPGAAPTAGVAGGPYDITAGNASGGTFSTGNYSISYADGTLGVIPAPLGIAANSATRLYGDANPAFSATYNGFQNGETPAVLTGGLTLATPAVPASNTGSYTIIPSGQGSTNYTISYVNGSLRVTPVSLMITADTKSKIYGTGDPALTFTATGLVNNQALGVVDTADTVLSGTLTRTPGETVLGGPYPITRGTLAANGNYTLSSFTGNSFDITPAVLEVSANAQSKLYGTNDPALTYSVTGLVHNPGLGIADTADSVLSGSLTRISGETVAGGPYSITRGTLAAGSNYTLTGFTGNDLIINPAGLSVAANPQSKLFGQSDPALTYSVAGLVNNPALGITDSAASVLSGMLTRAPGESALGGPYRINQGSIAANSNYILGFTGSNLIITGAAAEPVLGFNAGQVVFAGVINNEFYYRPGNFWHISLNPNNADPGFDVMRGTNDLNSRVSKRMDRCDSVFGGGMCESWSFPQQLEKGKKNK